MPSGQDPEQNLDKGCGLSHFHKLCQMGGLGQELLLCWVSILDYFQIMHLNFWIINFQQTLLCKSVCEQASIATRFNCLLPSLDGRDLLDL